MQKTMKEQLKGVVVKPKRKPRKIYFRGVSRPHAQQKPSVVIKVTRCAKNSRCKVCYKVRQRDDMVKIEGGGAQGHRAYFICPEHQ